MDSVGCMTGVLIMGGAIGCFAAGWSCSRHDMQNEAVKRGAARWETAVDGSTSFVWTMPNGEAIEPKTPEEKRP